MERDGRTAQDLARCLAVPPLAASLLLSRGYDTEASARRFLQPSLADLHPPSLLLGLEAASARLADAISRQEPILLYGDYDVDGTSALVILKTALDLLGGRASVFVPHRLKDGYGMKAERIRQAASDGVRLIVSVDTGIRAAEVVRLASSLGLDTIVTDHHLPDAEIPPAVAVLNPNQPGCAYPNKHLCGAGVAFKLAHGLFARSRWPQAKVDRLLESLLKMAALATVADIVPLTGENRAIVKLGLAGMADVKNPGLRALLDVAGIRAGTAPTARQVGFQIGPRINAAGRMASASEVLDLFFTPDASQARAIAAALDELNRHRQATEEEMRQAIFSGLDADPRMGLVLYDPSWHLGVAGIVAGRIAEKYRKPVFVLARDEKEGSTLIKGSGRSLPGFHLLDALESMAHLFTQHGGHEQAAGVTLEMSRLQEFASSFALYAAARLNDDIRRPRLKIEANVTASQVDTALFTAIGRLEPFGYYNPAPLLALRDAEVVTPPLLMKGKHIKLTVRQQGRLLNLKGWNLAESCAWLKPGACIDAAFQLDHDSWDGWAATIKAVRPAIQ